MNIQAEQQDIIEQPIYNFIKQVMPMTLTNGNNALDQAQQETDNMVYAKQILDQYFPLSHGSHQDVCSYVVYYNQLLAFFANGQQSGLAQPRQFVAFTGHKCEPSTILMKNNGFHLEISLAAKGKHEICDLAGIEDVQVEAALMTIVSRESTPASRSWTSLISGQVDHRNKQFTAKDGEPYEL
ncbi:malate synthase [Shewanella sp. Isolate11]|uniref:malate synthase n=1 Tax=Shewanella sp. Isolate11 TaxID=2908530 RepID=UPI001EFD87B1|nr:malate synthase [Shewanella sp. Isolate11]MCG9696190.1 malate synthase [Shewanella sp. Isolate11]